MNASRLPELPAATEPETAGERGARALAWILETGVTVTLETSDLERADSAAIDAICSPDMSELARERVSAVRHEIAATLRIRRELDKRAEPVAGAPPCGRDSGGQLAPLRPGPVTRPPAPERVEIDF